tara:strand:+ start:454 stop:795 length:342 start_codon:yes stop_codon:yes gene_type:complete
MEDWLNSPELQALRKAWAEVERLQNAEDDAWWDKLDYDGKSQAFRQITKLMYKAEVTNKGSYRYALYNVFGLEYGDGLTYYMQLHNLIVRGIEDEKKACTKDNKEQHSDSTCD